MPGSGQNIVMGFCIEFHAMVADELVQEGIDKGTLILNAFTPSLRQLAAQTVQPLIQWLEKTRCDIKVSYVRFGHIVVASRVCQRIKGCLMSVEEYNRKSSE
jgi:hypothetical protein